MTLRTLLLVSLLAIPACAVDDSTDGDIDVGEAEQAVTSTTLRTFSSSAYGMTTWDNIAPTAGTLCFIAGVDGNWQGAHNDVALLGVYPSGDHWGVTIYNNGHPESITVACTSGVTNVTDQIFWKPEWGDVWHAGTANTHCFLTSLGAGNGGLSQFDDQVRIDKGFGNNWRLHGTVATSGAFMDARMMCADYGSGQGIWGGAWTAMGTVGGPLASNSAGGVACGLTAVGGDFGFNSLSSGVKITYDSRAAQWNWTLSDIKQGTAECVK